MKKSKKIIAVLVITLLIFANVTLATNVPTNENQNVVGNTENVNTTTNVNNVETANQGNAIPEENWRGMDSVAEETKEDNIGDHFEISDIVSITKDLDGNLYVIGRNVDLSEVIIYGNVFIIAENVKVNADITGAAYIIASDIDVNGSMTDAYLIAENITFSESSCVTRDMKVGGSNLTIDGEIQGSLYSEVENINITENGYVAKNIHYVGELKVEDEKQYGGELVKEEVKAPEVPEKEDIVKGKVNDVITKTLTALVIVGILVLTAYDRFDKEITAGDVIKGFGLGWVYIIVIPVVIILMIVTIIGLPLACILLMVYILLYMLAMPLVSLKFARVLLKDEDNKVKTWLVASVIYIAIAILELVPVVGTIIVLVFGPYGFDLMRRVLFSKKSKKETESIQVVSDNEKKE